MSHGVSHEPHDSIYAFLPPRQPRWRALLTSPGRRCLAKHTAPLLAAYLEPAELPGCYPSGDGHVLVKGWLGGTRVYGFFQTITLGSS